MATLFMSLFSLPHLMPEAFRRYLSELTMPEATLGEDCYLVPLVLEGSNLRIPEDIPTLHVTASECQADFEGTLERSQAIFRDILRETFANYDPIGVMFVSRDASGTRVFQSTYYTMDGIHRLLIQNGFEGCAISIRPCGKGMVVIVQPENEVSGDQALITCINNVIGNAFYGDQSGLLRRMAAMVKGEPSPWSTGRAPSSLESWRAHLDRIDAQILRCVARRMSISQQIGVFKREQGLSIWDPERESSVLDSRRSIGAGLGLDQTLVEKIMGFLMDHSKKVQAG